MSRKNNLYIAFLTVFACLMVVFFHTNGVFKAYDNTTSWKIACAERCIVFSAIPIFFMLTGAKLMNYRERYGTREYLKKRLLRVGLPFLFWNLFVLLFDRVVGGSWGFTDWRDFAERFLNSGFQSRYWFFFPLFAVYAAIPVVSLLLQVKEHRKYLWYSVLLAFGLTWVLRPVCMLLGIAWNNFLLMPTCAGFFGYVLFGYLVSTELWSRKKRILLYIAAAAGVLFAFFWTRQASAQAEKTVETMVDYGCFPAGLLGAAIFVFFRHFDFSWLAVRPRISKLLFLTADACMGIWLTHTLCLTLLIELTGLSKESYLWRFAIPIATFLLCLLGVRLVKRLPLLKWLV